MFATYHDESSLPFVLFPVECEEQFSLLIVMSHSALCISYLLILIILFSEIQTTTKRQNAQNDRLSCIVRCSFDPLVVSMVFVSTINVYTATLC